MAKSFEAYLPPKRPPNTARVQAWVPLELFNAVNEIRKRRRLKWNELFIGMCEKLVEDLYEKREINSVTDSILDDALGNGIDEGTLVKIRNALI